MSEETVNPIEDLVQAALDQNFNAAADIFGDVMGEKMSDALEQEKIAVANRIYNGEEPEEDIDFDEEDLELDDEDLEEDEEHFESDDEEYEVEN